MSGLHLITPLTQKAERIAELINDFDDTLELQWIPPEDRKFFQKAVFRIVQNHPNFPQYVVMALTEDQLDERVIAALFKARSGNVLSDLEAEEAAKTALQLKERMEEYEEKAEFARWAINSKKTVKHKGVTFK